jgi:hypothetical protein
MDVEGIHLRAQANYTVAIAAGEARNKTRSADTPRYLKPEALKHRRREGACLVFLETGLGHAMKAVSPLRQLTIEVQRRVACVHRVSPRVR